MSLPTVSPPSKGGWGAIKTVDPCSLNDVMSEELAKKLQVEDEEVRFEDWTHLVEDPDGAQGESSVDPFQAAAGVETDSDFLMAQMLQHEFDKEADSMLKKVESKYNGNSKISVSFDNFRHVHPAQRAEVDEEDDEDDYDLEDIALQKSRAKFNKNPRGGGTGITTKHDAVISGRTNTARGMDNLDLDFGDGESFDMKLPNRVFNNLRNHSVQESKRAARLHEKKDHSSATEAIDPKTKLLLFKLVGGMLQDVNGVISSGKESVVLHATGGEAEGMEISEECAIKVFKTTLTTFKNREIYVRGDTRFAKDQFKKQSTKKVMKIWAEKEKLNLKRMRRFGVSCPQVVWLKDHVLIMSFIGKNMVPAPKLKTADLSMDELQVAYAQCIENMKIMYTKCGLVHGDLSEFNVLWHEGKVWFIDVSQACTLSNPNANVFLMRDCINITSFFRKLGVPGLISEYQLFNELTGLDLKGEDEEFLQQIQQYENKDMFISLGQERREFAFDYLFDKSQQVDKDVSDDTNDDDNQDDDDDEIKDYVEDNCESNEQVVAK